MQNVLVPMHYVQVKQGEDEYKYKGQGDPDRAVERGLGCQQYGKCPEYPLGRRSYTLAAVSPIEPGISMGTPREEMF